MLMLFCYVMSCRLSQVNTKIFKNNSVSIFGPEDGDSIFFRNFGIYLRVTRRQNPEEHGHIPPRENLRSQE